MEGKAGKEVKALEVLAWGFHTWGITVGLREGLHNNKKGQQLVHLLPAALL